MGYKLEIAEPLHKPLAAAHQRFAVRMLCTPRRRKPMDNVKIATMKRLTNDFSNVQTMYQHKEGLKRHYDQDRRLLEHRAV